MASSLRGTNSAPVRHSGLRKRWLPAVAGCMVFGCALTVGLPVSVAQTLASESGQSAEAGPIGLAQAYEQAIQQDATLRATRAQTVSTAEREVQARAQLRPRVSFTASRFHNDLDRTQPNFLGQSTTTQEKYYSHSQTLQVRQPIYRPALSLGVDGAVAQTQDAEATLERAVQTLGVRVVESYLQVLLAQDRQALLHTQHRLATQQLDAARKRFDGGQGIRTDMDEAQARLDLLAAQQLEASQARETALMQLQLMTQRPASGVYALDSQALGVDSFDARTPQHWLEKAEASSPEIKALQARLESARIDVQRASAGHKPTLDAVVQINRSGSESVTSTQSAYINRQVGLQFDLPLYAGGAIQSAVRQALAEQTRAEETLEATRRDLALRIQREWRGITEGVLRTSALQRAVASADQVVVSVRRSFEAGMRTVLDVLNAEQQAQQARRDLGEARLTYVASRLRLLALAGELDQRQMELAASWFRP